MDLRESWATSLANLAGHKLRSALSMLGVVFGVGAVIAMLSIGAGAERQALEMIEQLGVRNVLLRAKTFDREEAQEIRRKSTGLSLRDCEAMLQSVPGVELVAPKVSVDPWSVLAGREKARAQLYGVSARHAELVNLRIEEGRFLDQRDVLDHSQVAVIGPGVRRELFGHQPALGADLKVDDVWLTVVGVLADSDQGASFEGVSLQSSASAIYVPVTSALSKFDRDPLESPLQEIVVRLDEGSQGAASRIAARAIDRLI